MNAELPPVTVPQADPGAAYRALKEPIDAAVAQIVRKEKDPRVKEMLDGYFLDLYLALREVRRVCKRRAHVAFVVGNAQYRGVPLAVDELTAEVGEQAGLKCEKLMVARYRGNSAQQMGKYGRNPSRETVVVFRRP